MQVIRLNDTAWDEEELEKAGVTFAIYYYECEGYEGLGKCLAFQDNKWYTCDLSHCSCYGPFDSYPENGPFNTVEEAVKDLEYMDWSKYFTNIIQKMADEATKKWQGHTLKVDQATKETIVNTDTVDIAGMWLG